jgi:hypothetical protein
VFLGKTKLNKVYFVKYTLFDKGQSSTLSKVLCLTNDKV